LSFAAFNPPLRVGSKRTDDDMVYVLVDPDDFEESCCSQTVTVCVDQGGGRIVRVEMNGGTMLDPSDLGKLVKRAGQRWEEWKFALDAV
jgi:exosome complex RNA-binding protein Rrp42 (RNase PH superfamily)